VDNGILVTSKPHVYPNHAIHIRQNQKPILRQRYILIYTCTRVHSYQFILHLLVKKGKFLKKLNY